MHVAEEHINEEVVDNNAADINDVVVNHVTPPVTPQANPSQNPPVNHPMELVISDCCTARFVASVIANANAIMPKLANSKSSMPVAWLLMWQV